MGDNIKSKIVIDNGSSLIKAGLSSNSKPKSVFPSIVGISNQSRCYIGEEALSVRGLLKYNYPIDRGLVNNWDIYEKLLSYTFKTELCVSPEEHSLIMTDSPLNSKSNRERMTEILFEKFNVPSLHICNSAVASMFASGLSNGIVLDSGDGCTHVVPVYDGYSLPHAILPFEISGKDLTNHLVKLLMEKDFAFTTTSEKLLVRDIKEKLAYVALDYNQELKGNEKDIEKTYELPDGTDLSIGNHRFRCTEPLFKSELLNSNSSGGIHELIHNSILKCNGDLRKDMYSNILLSGGNTMIDRLSERLKHEITLLAPPGTTVNIISPPDRSFSTWIGASMLASSESFQQKLITKKEYKEYGATIIHQKCF